MLDGISGCYALDRVRPLNILQDSDDPLIVKVGDLIEQKRPLEEIVHAAKIAVEQKQIKSVDDVKHDPNVKNYIAKIKREIEPGQASPL